MHRAKREARDGQKLVPTRARQRFCPASLRGPSARDTQAEVANHGSRSCCPPRSGFPPGRVDGAADSMIACGGRSARWKRLHRRHSYMRRGACRTGRLPPAANVARHRTTRLAPRSRAKGPVAGRQAHDLKRPSSRRRRAPGPVSAPSRVCARPGGSVRRPRIVRPTARGRTWPRAGTWGPLSRRPRAEGPHCPVALARARGRGVPVGDRPVRPPPPPGSPEIGRPIASVRADDRLGRADRRGSGLGRGPRP
jgi:hypothetical protein